MRVKRAVMPLCLIAVWIACGVINYGMAYAMFGHERNLSSPWERHYFRDDCWYDRHDHQFALFAAIAGPIWIVPLYIMSDFAHAGLRFKRERPECI